MDRKIIFKSTADGTELTLPVTPASFSGSFGISIETINIHTLGDVSLAGYGKLGSLKIEALFPAQAYPFNNGGSVTSPYSYVEKMKRWCSDGTVLRYVVSNTEINEAVLVEEIQYSEKDGTGDVYATISLKGHKSLSAPEVEDTGTGNQSRQEEEGTADEQLYTIVSGDTLWAICRKFYGDPLMYPGLARYNGIANPHLIYPGHVLRIPDKSLL